MPKVSVIIPTYNRECYVTKAIESILYQTFSDYEIIVVDDGSVDGTREAVKRYGERIRYIYQRNAGVSAARNTGIFAARGEWIAYLDSDDEWMSGYLAAQMASTARYPEAVAHVANSRFIFHDQPHSSGHFEEVGMQPVFHGTEHILVEKPFRTIISRNHWFLQPILMHRDALLESGVFNEQLTIAEDMDVVARLALQGPFSFNRCILVNVHRRLEPGGINLSSQYLTRGIYSRKAFAQVYGNLLAHYRLSFPERLALCKMMCRKWRAVGNLYVLSQKRREARKCYRKALAAYPSMKTALKYLGTFFPQQLAMLVVRREGNVVPGDEEI